MPVISFQGSLGAYSHMACQNAYPDYEVLPCLSFAEAMEKVAEGEADLAMIPIENSSAGRVIDAQQLLLSTSLHIIAEHFQPVHHCLLGVKGATLADIKTVQSHIQALGQCAQNIRQHGFKPQIAGDTAGAAHVVATEGDKSKAAIASSLTASIYGLDILKENFEDFSHNTTRFMVFSQTPQVVDALNPSFVSLVFEVLNQPAALYKALECFAAQDVNLVKLESYVDSAFQSALFYVEVMGHPQNENTQKALKDLEKMAKNIQLKGVYPLHRFRQKNNK